MPYNYTTAAAFSGGPYFSRAISGNTVRNNGATIMLGGNIQAVPAANGTVFAVSNALGNTYLGYHSGLNGAVVPLNPTGMGVGKALSSGAFAGMTAGKFTMIGPSSQQIAGISSTLLQNSGMAGGRKSENSYTGFVRYNAYIMTGGWLYQTGQPVFRRDQTDSIPNETLPTQAIPGRLTYMITGTTAKNDAYKAKTD